ncbi:hypothetical protein V6N13_014039 [Hibiscus sabdariffa]
MALQGRHLWFTICGKVLIKVPEPSSGPTKTSDFDPGGYTSLNLHGGGTSRRLREGYPESDPIPYTEMKTSRKRSRQAVRRRRRPPPRRNTCKATVRFGFGYLYPRRWRLVRPRPGRVEVAAERVVAGDRG